MIKLKDIIKESKWSDRKWGDPLPTLEDYVTFPMFESDDDDAFVHVGQGRYKEKNRATGKPLPNSPTYKKSDSGNYEMIDDDPTGGDPDDAWDDEEGRAKPKGKTDADTDDDEPAGKLGGGDYERDGGEPEDKPFGGDTGKDADFDPDDGEGEPDFYDPEDYEKHYPEKTKPKDEVGDIKYGKGFSPDSDHMFDSVANSAPDASDKYSGMVDSAKSGNWEKFRAGIHDIYDEDAREHLLNLANHVDAGTYKSEFPSGKKGLKFGRKEVMDMFRQAAEYGDEQFGGDEDEDDLEDPAGGKGDAWMHGKSEESITINGKQYKRISESVEPTVFDPFKEAKKQLGSLYTRMKGK